jgi:hypothetical protein
VLGSREQNSHDHQAEKPRNINRKNKEVAELQPA